MSHKVKVKENSMKDTKKEIRNQSRLLLVLALALLVTVTAGVSYAFFTYTKLGTTENIIRTGTITFLYDKENKERNGISITDALPISDIDAKKQMGSNNVFDFKILATSTGNTSLSYEITARRKENNTDSLIPDSNIKIYLTEVVNNIETPTPLTLDSVNVKRYSELNQTGVDVGSLVEKTIYRGTVTAGTTNYKKDFRLRMWIADDTDYSTIKDSEGNDIYPMNDKAFAVTINVYANATVITSSE